MFNSKGQSALEYLMTYGWALVVIVIVVAALYVFGVFNPPTPTVCTGFAADFGTYSSHLLRNDGNFSLSLVTTKDITITAMTLGGQSLSGISPTTVSRGSTTVVSATGGPTGTAGNTYSGQALQISYNNTTDGFNNLTASATCSGTYQ